MYDNLWGLLKYRLRRRVGDSVETEMEGKRLAEIEVLIGTAAAVEVMIEAKVSSSSCKG